MWLRCFTYHLRLGTVILHGDIVQYTICLTLYTKKRNIMF